MSRKLLKHSMKKEVKKTNRTIFRIEKGIKKVINFMLSGKIMKISLIAG